MDRKFLEALLVCSQITLQDLELARLNEAANHRKNLIQIFDAAIDAAAEARLARAIIDWQIATGKARPAPVQHAFDFPDSRPATLVPGPHKIRKRETAQLCRKSI